MCVCLRKTSLSDFFNLICFVFQFLLCLRCCWRLVVFQFSFCFSTRGPKCLICILLHAHEHTSTRAHAQLIDAAIHIPLMHPPPSNWANLLIACAHAHTHTQTHMCILFTVMHAAFQFKFCLIQARDFYSASRWKKCKRNRQHPVAQEDTTSFTVDEDA